MSAPLPEQVQADVARALAEDLGSGDLTAGLIDERMPIQARVICREEAVLAGRAWFDEVMRQVDESIAVNWQQSDGQRLVSGQTVCVIEGKPASILSAERTALNFLQTLSGTATRVARYVSLVAGTGVRILDTRKTIPGLRLAQKYAVTQGGGSNHRMGLYDAILIKENHIAAAGSIAAVVAKARILHPEVPLEIEVETLDELSQALEQGVERVLLDNFSLQGLRNAVRLNQGRARLEASGGITAESVRAIAETGIDDISIGTLTKDLQSVDYSMLFVKG